MVVGREREIAEIQARFGKMLSGRGSVLFLTGEAGLGKTTLVRTWRDSAMAGISAAVIDDDADKMGAKDGFVFTEAACSIPIGGESVGSLESLQPWADIVANLQAQEESRKFEKLEPVQYPGDAKPKNRRKDTKNLIRDTASSWALAIPVVGGAAHAAIETHRLIREQREEAPGRALDVKKLIHDAAPAWAWALPVVGEIAHAAVETHRLVSEHRSEDPHAPAAQNQQQVFQQYANLLSKIAEQTPLVIFLDDMHWSDVSSCNMLFHLSRSVAEKRILIIVTYRLEDALAANEGKGHGIISVKNEVLRYSTGEEFALSFLDRAAIHHLLLIEYPQYTSDETFEQWLHKISDGNALFVSQFIRTLREDGHLDEKGAFHGDYDSVTIPQSALAVIEERTRRLDDETREILCYASTEGEEFTSYMLGQLTQKKPLELLKDLKKAERHAIIRQKGSLRLSAKDQTTVFGFSHALFHRALYESLGEEERQILHRACFDTFQGQWMQEPVNEKLQAAIAPKLLTHAEKCEEYGFAAEVALRAAQEFWKEFSEHETLEMLSKVEAYGDKHSSTAPMECEKYRTEILPAAYLLRGTVDDIRSRFDDALVWFGKAEVIAKNAGNASLKINAMAGSAEVILHRGEFMDLVDYAEILHKESDAAEYEKGIAAALKYIGIANSELGDQPKALDCFTRALEIYQKLNDLPEQIRMYNSIGNVQIYTGEFDTAKTNYEKSLSLSRQHNMLLMEATAQNSMGIICSLRNENNESLQCFQRSLQLCETIGDKSGMARTLSNIGMIFECLYDYTNATTSLMQSLDMLDTTSLPNIEATTMYALGKTQCEIGNMTEAMNWFEKSLMLATTIGDKHLRGHNFSAIADVHKYQFHNELAQINYEEAMNIFHELNASPEEYINALINLADLQINVCNYKAGINNLSQALTLGENINHKKVQSFALFTIGKAYRLIGDMEHSRTSLEKSLMISIDIHAKDTVAEAYGELGLLAETEGKHDEALQLLRQCTDLIKTVLPRAYPKWQKELERVEAGG